MCSNTKPIISSSSQNRTFRVPPARDQVWGSILQGTCPVWLRGAAHREKTQKLSKEKDALERQMIPCLVFENGCLCPRKLSWPPFLRGAGFFTLGWRASLNRCAGPADKANIASEPHPTASVLHLHHHHQQPCLDRMEPFTCIFYR